MKDLFLKIIFLQLIIYLTSCSNEKVPKEISPKFETKYELDIPEPSDLALSYDGNSLWTVSDDNSTVYQISFEGKIIKSFEVDGLDLEGITPIDKNTLAVVLERDRTIVFIDLDGNELNRVKIDLDGEPNSGFEGITFNTKNKHLYIVNEKEPGLLIELNSDYEILNKVELTFAKDYSGIIYNNDKDRFWIISDESSLIAECDINGNMLQSFVLELPQVEGVAIDKRKGKLYIVSDNTEQLYIFDL